MNKYELMREEQIARNNARLAELEVREHASCFQKKYLAHSEHRKNRAPKVKGAFPTRRSERPTKPAHTVLSEVSLSGEGPTERLRYKISRKRFESETMPLKRKAQHDFDEAFEFTNEDTRKSAEDWFRLLKLQPEFTAASWDSTCETIAHNLGNDGVKTDSIAGGSEELITLIYNTAVYGVGDPVPLGTQLAVKRVLQHLLTGRDPSSGCLHPA